MKKYIGSFFYFGLLGPPLGAIVFVLAVVGHGLLKSLINFTPLTEDDFGFALLIMFPLTYLASYIFAGIPAAITGIIHPFYETNLQNKWLISGLTAITAGIVTFFYVVLFILVDKKDWEGSLIFSGLSMFCGFILAYIKVTKFNSR